MFALIALVCCLATAQGQSFEMQDPNAPGNPPYTAGLVLSVPAGGILQAVPLRIASTNATAYPVTVSLSSPLVPYFGLTAQFGTTPFITTLIQQLAVCQRHLPGLH